jgi:two-component system, OmpR family, sensor kinase
MMAGIATGISIRARLVLGMVVLVSVGLTVANVTGILLLRSYLVDRVDSQVAAIGAGPGSAEPPSTVTPEPDILCENPQDPRGLRSDFVVLVLDAEGNVACSLGPDLGDAAPDLASVPRTTSDLVTVPSLDGEDRWRLRVVSEETDGERLVFAVSLADADATVGRLTRIAVLISVLVLALTGAAAWLIAGLGLRPLTRIEETAERIAAGDLTERVPSFRERTEVGRLAAALNGMLGQIERAFSARTESEDTLRRFISDASHELRTPLATIRGHAELWRNGFMRQGRDLDTLVGRIESESTRMGVLVDDMLLLARLDQARPLERRPVDLLSLATDAVIDAQARQPERHITLTHAPAEHPPVVMGDEARLQQVITNLLANALDHTPVSSSVSVSVETHHDVVEISVADAGPGMPEDVVPRVFDRFYRADPGRARDQGGTGLGLAIVKSLVHAHGGSVTCRSTRREGTTVAVRFARAQSL